MFKADTNRLLAVGSAALITLLTAAAFFALSVYGFGFYGCGLFLALPFLVGFVPTAFLAGLRQPVTLVQAFWIGMAIAAAGTSWLLLSGVEGLICIVLAIPLAAPLIFIGVFAAHRLFHEHRLRYSTMTIVLLIAASLSYTIHEASAPREAPLYLAEHSVLVQADAPAVWQTVITLDEVPRSDDWMFRAGVACPERVKIVDGREGGVRVCKLSTGRLYERIDGWQPNRRLSWTTLSTPPPMKELNPFAVVDAPHLHESYRSVRGEFELAPAGPGVTRVTRRTWYEHDLRPAGYWSFWCDLAAARIHYFVLDHVRTSAEARANPQT